MCVVPLIFFLTPPLYIWQLQCPHCVTFSCIYASSSSLYVVVIVWRNCFPFCVSVYSFLPLIVFLTVRYFLCSNSLRNGYTCDGDIVLPCCSSDFMSSYPCTFPRESVMSVCTFNMLVILVISAMINSNLYILYYFSICLNIDIS